MPCRAACIDTRATWMRPAGICTGIRARRTPSRVIRIDPRLARLRRGAIRADTHVIRPRTGVTLVVTRVG